MMAGTTTSVEGQDASRLKGQNRIRLMGLFFASVFLAITVQLVRISIIAPMNEEAKIIAEAAEHIPRPDIVDRNGIVLATDIAVASLYADPRKIIDIDEAVELITATVPDIDSKVLLAKFKTPGKAFVWLKRQVSPEERDAVYNLGIPGVGYVNERKRVYPQGRLAVSTRRRPCPVF